MTASKRAILWGSAEGLKHKESARIMIGETIRARKKSAIDVGAKSRVAVIERAFEASLDVIYRPEHTAIEKLFLAATLVALIARMDSPLFAFVSPAASMDACRQRANHLKTLSKEMCRRHERELEYFNENRALEFQELGRDEAAFAERENEVENYAIFLQSMHDSGELTADELHELRHNSLLYWEYISSVIFITPQVPFPNIVIDGQSIRVDVVIWSPHDELFNMIVECDGYETHAVVECESCGATNRSKQDKSSFVRDRKRDRELLRNGYSVLRYSGSELNQDIFACARDIGDQIYKARIRHLLLRRGLDTFGDE